MRVAPEKQGDCTAEVIAWLHRVYLGMEGIESHVVPDPFYERNEVLTRTVIEAVIAGIEAVYTNELQRYPGWHHSANHLTVNQVLVMPGYSSLPLDEQLALVQGIDRICQKYRATPAEEAAIEKWIEQQNALAEEYGEFGYC